MRRRKKKRNSVIGIMTVILVLLVIVLGVLLFFKIKDGSFQFRLDFKKKAAEKKQEADSMQEEGEDSMQGQIEASPMQPISELEVGATIDITAMNPSYLPQYFVINPINADILQYINGRSYVDNDDIQLRDLRYLKVLYYNYNHEVQVGELIVNVEIADDCRNIFLELFEQQYEIQSMYLIERYWTGDGASSDKESIQNNNTSAFNYRKSVGGNRLSNHAIGRAIDINPLQNPYVAYNADGSFKEVYLDMEKYIDRASGEPHMIGHEDACYQIFTKYGFTWGGDWDSPKDYQHFEKQ